MGYEPLQRYVDIVLLLARDGVATYLTVLHKQLVNIKICVDPDPHYLRGLLDPEPNSGEKSQKIAKL